MLERTGIRRDIRGLLAAVASGRAGGLFLVGEAGIGKTSHLVEACRGRPPEMRVARARGDAMESNVAFGLFAQVFSDLGLPNLLHGADPSAPVAQVRAAKFFAALRRLESQAARQPLLLALDDLHWADPDSLALLSFLCRRIEGTRIGVLATMRPWPAAAEELGRHLCHEGRVTLARLEPLGEQAAAALLAERCGRRLAPETVARAWTLCRGNPLLLEELARGINRGGGVADLAPGRVAPRSETLLLGRFAGLTGVGVSYARAGSVLGISFRPAVAAEIAQLDESEEATAIEALTRAGLVRSAARRLEFAHPLFGQALYDEIPAGVRNVLHRRAFGGLLDRGLIEEAAEHATRADLHGDERAIALLAQTGENALRTGALSTAVSRLRAALDLAGGSPRPEIELVLGWALLESGRPLEAVATGLRVLDTSGSAPGAGALRLLGVAHYAAGEHDAAAIRFDQAVAVAELEQPEVAVTALLLHAVLLSLTTGPAAALREVARARDMAQRVDEPLRRRVEGTWGYIAVLTGDPAGGAAAMRAARALQADPRTASVRRAWREITMYGAVAKYLERFEEAQGIYARSAALVEECELPGAVAAVCTGAGEVLARVGALEPALAATDRACAVAEFATHVTAALATANRAHLLLLKGRVEESAALCARAEAMALEGRGSWLPLMRAWDLQAQVLLRDGASSRAASRYRQTMDLAERVGLGEPCVVPWAGHAINAHLACGDLAEVHRVLAWITACSERLPCRWPRIVAAMARARLAERGGDHDFAEAQFGVAIDLHQGLALPIDWIETLLEWGAFLRRRGQLRRARSVLAEALAAAEAHGAEWFAGIARRELGSAGGRRRRSGGDPDALTAAEQRVVRLAATGLSNREIADQLWLSANTVGTHLRRIYAKLGVHSRRELIAAMAAGGEVGPRDTVLRGRPESHLAPLGPQP